LKEYLDLFNGLIKLLEIGNRRKDKHYEYFVHICYESAREIRDNFLHIFEENERLIEQKRCLDSAVIYLGEQRKAYLSKRDSLRANLESVSGHEFNEFEIGLKRLVVGHDWHALRSNQMNLMALIKQMKDSDSEYLDQYIGHALRINDEAIKIVENSWSLINKGYIEYKKEYLKR
jgi:hypothetical protein